VKIGILGTGNIGATIARKLAAAGHQVAIANSRSPGMIAILAAEIGAAATLAESVFDQVDAIILSIPFAKIPDISMLLLAVPASVPVIDTSNYYPMRDGIIAGLDGDKPESVWVSEQLGRSVIKAWNAVLSDTLAERGMSRGMPGRLALPIAGDDARGKAVAMGLVDATGFDAYDAGTLADSWRQQAGNPGYCTDLTLGELVPALAAANRTEAPRNRERTVERLMALNGHESHDERVAMVRAMSAPR
jgi:8-hydroxy-5-deazaflavin:NADPH oxidoreductase